MRGRENELLTASASERGVSSRLSWAACHALPGVKLQMTSADVVRVLDQLVEHHGEPGIVKIDNGPEFVAKKVQDWLEAHGADVRFIEPGSPWQNGHNESFNVVFRDGCLNRWLFESLREAREASEAWLEEYNVERPHGSRGGRVPAEFFEPWGEQNREAA